MNKGYLISFLICSVIGIFYYFSLFSEDLSYANSVYRVYLEGSEIGLIEDEDELYNLINEEQQEIKELYNVDVVYPPSDFDIVKVDSYNSEIVSASTIYSMIENKDNFTIKGYQITIVDDSSEDSEEIIVNVIDRDVFENAIASFVDAYIDNELYYQYLNGQQPEIVDTGLIITSMYFNENISIQEAFISVNEKIYTDEEELLQYLIFGEDAEILKYEVEVGDTISTIADDNQLSTSEFLISNPSYRDENTMLTIGDTVNVTLQNPVINFIYEVEEIAEVETDYLNTKIYDANYSTSYSVVTTEGVTGVDKVTMEYQVTNGITSQEVTITDREVVIEAVDQVTTVGTYTSSGSGSVSYGDDGLNTGLSFGSPVESGFIVTSAFGVWRSSYQHMGTDFSGTGYGSNIYAIADGVVTQAANACSSCSQWEYGTFIVISHGNNYYSIYMHMIVGSLKVSVGDTVSKGQIIGSMGSTGNSTGTHLHLGFSVGEPNTGSSVTYYDAYDLIFG